MARTTHSRMRATVPVPERPRVLRSPAQMVDFAGTPNRQPAGVPPIQRQGHPVTRRSLACFVRFCETRDGWVLRQVTQHLHAREVAGLAQLRANLEGCGPVRDWFEHRSKSGSAGKLQPVIAARLFRDLDIQPAAYADFVRVCRLETGWQERWLQGELESRYGEDETMATTRREQVAAELDARGVDLAKEVPIRVQGEIASELGFGSVSQVSVYIAHIRRDRGVPTPPREKRASPRSNGHAAPSPEMPTEPASAADVPTEAPADRHIEQHCQACGDVGLEGGCSDCGRAAIIPNDPRIHQMHEGNDLPHLAESEPAPESLVGVYDVMALQQAIQRPDLAAENEQLKDQIRSAKHELIRAGIEGLGSEKVSLADGVVVLADAYQVMKQDRNGAEDRWREVRAEADRLRLDLTEISRILDEAEGETPDVPLPTRVRGLVASLRGLRTEVERLTEYRDRADGLRDEVMVLERRAETAEEALRVFRDELAQGIVAVPEAAPQVIPVQHTPAAVLVEVRREERAPLSDAEQHEALFLAAGIPGDGLTGLSVERRGLVLLAASEACCVVGAR